MPCKAVIRRTAAQKWPISGSIVNCRILVVVSFVNAMQSLQHVAKRACYCCIGLQKWILIMRSKAMKVNPELRQHGICFQQCKDRRLATTGLSHYSARFFTVM